MFGFIKINNIVNLLKAYQPIVLPRSGYGHGPLVKLPRSGARKAFRRIVHFPDEYTVKPLEVTNLGGRDPVTGRKVVSGIGGGIKHKYHWIKWFRDGPKEGAPKLEKVIKILKCGCRTGHVALVASNDELKYILATENMKPGDVIKTSRFIPTNPVKANEGDAYPVGALPLGTIVHNVQLHPSSEYTVVHSAGCYAKIKSHLDDRVVVTIRKDKDISIQKECMVTVGRVSNAVHSSIHIGSAQKLRELGFRPRSGLWKRKTGRFGRKIKPPPKLEIIDKISKSNDIEYIKCTKNM